MKKEAFLRELEYLLSDLPDDEREEAVGYYRDYFDEAGVQDEDETDVWPGSPEKAAAEIRAGLSGDSQGEFTERGYQDERFREAYHVPDQYAEIIAADGERSRKSESRDPEEEEGVWASFEKEGKSCREEWSKWRKERERRNGRGGERCQEKDYRNSGEPRWWEYKNPRRKQSGGADDGRGSEAVRQEGFKKYRDNSGSRGLLIFLLVLFFGVPVACSLIGAGFSVIGGVLGGIVGIFAGVFGLAVVVFAAALAAFGGGIALILSGVAGLSSLAVSLMSVGGGFLLLALSMLLFLLAKWGCTTAVPWMAGIIRDIVRLGLGWLHEMSERVFRDRRDRL